MLIKSGKGNIIYSFLSRNLSSQFMSRTVRMKLTYLKLSIKQGWKKNRFVLDELLVLSIIISIFWVASLKTEVPYSVGMEKMSGRE